MKQLEPLAYKQKGISINFNDFVFVIAIFANRLIMQLCRL